MMHWSAPFVGIPYVKKGRALVGADCWGVFRLALELRGIDLPAYADVDPDDHTKKTRLFQQGAGSDDWVKVSSPKEFDAVLFRMGRYDSHIGVVVGRGLMLHADRAAGQSVVERFDSVRWANRLVGFYRHRNLA